jgi:hypothetical protein
MKNNLNDLLKYLSPTDISRLEKRRAFHKDRMKFLRTVKERSLSVTEISSQIGLKPKSLGVMLSESTLQSFRYNYPALIKAMEFVGLQPSEDLMK